MKKLIHFCLLTVIAVSFSKQQTGVLKNKLFEDKINHTTDVISHTYVRVLINGIWWIYEYNDDGKLINVFIDEE